MSFSNIGWRRSERSSRSGLLGLVPSKSKMHYAGVMTEASAPEEARVIQCPKGEYLVIKGEGKTADELNNKLSGLSFGKPCQKQRILPMLVGQPQWLRWGSETA